MCEGKLEEWWSNEIDNVNPIVSTYIGISHSYHVQFIGMSRNKEERKMLIRDRLNIVYKNLLNIN